MKHKLWFAAVPLLAVPLLTGCRGSGYYETANFRFDGTLPWFLNDAVYDEETRCAERLLFTTGGGTVSVYESANTLSAETLANETGLAEKKELRCKYDAWEAVGDPQLDFQDRSMQQVYIWIAEEGHVLTLNCTLPEGSVGEFDINVQNLLDSVEYTGEPLEFTGGEADAGNLHAVWSADWKPSEYSGDALLRLELTQPQTEEEQSVSVSVYDITDAEEDAAARVQKALDSDGRETELTSFTAHRLNQTSFAGLPVQDAVYVAAFSKDQYKAEIFRRYFAECGGRSYEIMLTFSDSTETALDAHLPGITLTAKKVSLRDD